ncbi:hypothetical protein, partial [Aneurinibacillus aneurinilyticus]|uniref:hypothetical protein n=1 Tax=Aneurinibacillus aneurinilyticus TaxID=1391 RepID=UPI00366E03AF
AAVATITANTDGAWEKEVLANGEYDLYVVSGAALSTKITVTVSGGVVTVDPVDATKLTTNNGGITGAAGAVAANATVKVFAKDADPATAAAVATITANTDGAWEKEVLANGEYDLYVVSGATLSTKITVTVS